MFKNFGFYDLGSHYITVSRAGNSAVSFQSKSSINLGLPVILYRKFSTVNYLIFNTCRRTFMVKRTNNNLGSKTQQINGLISKNKSAETHITMGVPREAILIVLLLQNNASLFQCAALSILCCKLAYHYLISGM